MGRPPSLLDAIRNRQCLLFCSCLPLCSRFTCCSNPDPDTIPDKAVLICCSSDAGPQRNGDGTVDALQDRMPLFETVRFGGFLEGNDGFDCKARSNIGSIDTINSAIARAQSRKLQPFVLLVGGTDRAALSFALRSRFESNSGLARARITAVERCLTLTGESDAAFHPVVLRLVSGPSYTPRSSRRAGR